MGITLFFVLIGGQISSRLRLPAVIGELIAGIVIGPAFLNFVQPNSVIKTFENLGVIFLMFLAGLESNLKVLKKLWLPSVATATFGMILPIFIAYFTGLLFNFSKMESLFLGLVFAATSVSISVAVLQEMHRLKTKEGQTILGAAVVDDLLAILLLGIGSNFVGNANSNENSISKLGLSFIIQLVYLIILYLLSVFLVPRLMLVSKHLALPVAETLVAFIIVLLFSWGAEKTGLSSVLGAFFAGLALNQTHAKENLQKNFTIIGYSSFIPIFFASIGLQMQITSIVNNWLLVLLLFLGSIVSKLIGAGIGAKIAGFSYSSSFLIGSGMVSRGEMALVVAQIGLNKHLLSASIYSAVIGVIILTTVIAPILIKLASKRMNY